MNDEAFLTCLHGKEYQLIPAQPRSQSGSTVVAIPMEATSHTLPGHTLYDEVIAGRTCRSIPVQVIECDFSIKRYLHFTVSHVGEQHARLSTMESIHRGETSRLILRSFRYALGSDVPLRPMGPLVS